MSNFTGDFADYQRTLERAAQDVLDDERSGESDREDATDYWADSLTTYTSDALTVLRHTRNDNAYFDELGEKLEAENAGEVYTRLAWFAVRADIREEIERIEARED